MSDDQTILQRSDKLQLLWLQSFKGCEGYLGNKLPYINKGLIDSISGNGSTKKMSYFRGCHCNNLVMRLVLLVFFLGTASVVAGREALLPELWTREDMVQVAGYGEEKLSTVLVTGTVLCHTCSDKKSQNPSLAISGASVVVTCHASGKKRRSILAQGVTDENGDFIIDLPSELHAVPNLEKICSVVVHQLPRSSLCRPGFVRKHRGIRLSSVGNGIRTYTARTISLMDPISKLSPASMKKMAGKHEMSW